MNTPQVAKHVEALKDKDYSVRWSAAEALVEIGVPAVPILIEALKDKNSNVRGYVATALGSIGDASAVPALIHALQDQDNYVRSLAAAALGKIGNSDTLPRKILAVTQFSAPQRIEVLAALRQFHTSKKGNKRDDDAKTRELCQAALNEGDAAARTGAQAVLDWFKVGTVLVRPSQPDAMSKPQELVRPSQGGTPNVQPETSLRAADAPQGRTKQPPQRRNWRERLFGKRKDVAE